VIDFAVNVATERQARTGVAGAVDARPGVVRIGPAQIRQVIVDGMSVDIDEARGSGSVSVDGFRR